MEKVTELGNCQGKSPESSCILPKNANALWGTVSCKVKARAPPGAQCPATTSTAAHSEDTTLPAVICHGNSFTLCSAPQLLSQQAAGRAQGSAPEHPSSPGSSSSAAGMLGALHTSHPTAGPPHPKPASKCPSPSSVGRAGLWGSAAPSTPQQLLITVSTVGASMWVMAPARRCAPQNMQLT